MRVLLVEDDPCVANGLVAGLGFAGYCVDWVDSGELADQAVAAATHALVVLDIALPGVSGLELLRRWRVAGRETPVMLLTSRDTVADRVAGLDAGADDYLVKPFDLDELLARLRALRRRSSGHAAPRLTLGPLELDPAGWTCTLAGAAISLTRQEFLVLQSLMRNVGRVMTRQHIENSLYGWGDEIGSNAIEVHVHHLRRKLGNSLIRTVRGVGYTIEAPA
jgi:two-component system, OmpR family, response regulator QseB